MDSASIAQKVTEALRILAEVRRESQIIRAQILDERKHGLPENPVLTDRMHLCVRKLMTLQRDLLRLRADIIDTQLQSSNPIIPDSMPTEEV